MKKKIVTLLCAGALGFASTAPARAGVESDPAAVMADAVVARPLCLATTVLGSVAFVVTLPFSATSGSIGSTAKSLVGGPAYATFGRPLGDFTDYSSSSFDMYADPTAWQQTAQKPASPAAK